MTEKHVIFGSGAIGRGTAEELLKRGKSVKIVNRSGKMDEKPEGAELVAANLYDPASVRKVTWYRSHPAE